MRAPSRKRPLRRRVIDQESTVDFAEIAERVIYIGSPEHKDIRFFDDSSPKSLPKPRADALICDRNTSKDQALVTGWLKEAIKRGTVK